MEENFSRKTNYFTTRYSLFKEGQMHIDDILSPQTKEEAFLSFIERLKKDRIQTTIDNYNFVIYYSGAISESRHLFKFAKEVRRILNQASISDITETEVPDFPWCLMIIDTDQQLCLISKNSQISSSIITLKNYIAKAITEQLKSSHVSVQLELVTNKSVFWESIQQNSDDLRVLELTLISPNFLGQSYSTTTFLNQLKGECNNDSMTWRFENSQGRLCISRKSFFFKNLLEYISNGCGSWKIKRKSTSTPITSEDQAIEYPLDVDMFTLTASQKQDIQIAFAKIKAIENRNHKEGENHEESNS